jgi:hypothetical protein
MLLYQFQEKVFSSQKGKLSIFGNKHMLAEKGSYVTNLPFVDMIFTSKKA